MIGNKNKKYAWFFNIRKWWRQTKCIHYWIKFIVPYNPNKYPSNMYRKCTECGKIQWADLYGKFR